MEMLAHLHWDMDPVAFQVGPVTVRWYGLLFGLGFLAAFSLVRWMFRREGRNPDDVETLLVWTIFGTIVGARLMHCLAYEPARYLADPVSILKVWEGGLASHGGVLGIVIALYVHSRRHADQGFVWLLDRVSVAAVLSGVFVRCGNFMNSEILGTPSDAAWAVVFQRVDPYPRHPAQLYEAAAYLAVFAVLLALYRRLGGRTPPGLLVGLLLVLAFGARIGIELVKKRQAAFGEESVISMGQALSVLPVLIGIWLVWRARRLHAVG
jgi:prolipoprotein diacylglyceryl transferase